MTRWLRMVWLSAVLTATCHAFLAHAQVKEHTDAPNNRSADKPDPNPSPKNMLVLQGQKNPKLEIWFSAVYSTTNPACERQSMVGTLFGAPRSPQSVQEAVRVPSGQSEFSVRVNLDRYLPGRCNWQPISILKLIKDLDQRKQSAFSGVVDMHGIRRKTSLAYICEKWPPNTNQDSDYSILCHLAPGISFEMTSMSPEGGVVDLDYKLAPERH